MSTAALDDAEFMRRVRAKKEEKDDAGTSGLPSEGALGRFTYRPGSITLPRRSPRENHPKIGTQAWMNLWLTMNDLPRLKPSDMSVRLRCASPVDQKAERPSDEVLIRWFKNNEAYSDLTFHFKSAIDLWIRMVLDAYQEVTWWDCDLPSEVVAFITDLNSLILVLFQEAYEVAKRDNLPFCAGEPGSWLFLDQPQILEALKQFPGHARLFRVLDLLEYEPQHWSACLFVRGTWFGVEEDVEPIDRAAYGFPLGPLEIATKLFVERAKRAAEEEKRKNGFQVKWTYGDDPRLFGALLELTGKWFIPGMDGKNAG
ncbi:hypothetical protein BJ508DRAFT_330032 [Ascobolus immersus RN42]|uniref:Uncharacterized protein n=1 Tax=Ascobolus immersus RN42 TaxID=1160509 RepID=A0A3N4I0C6_ASCIM|nr:hypothetical protein BJ508DRAFT_330032 [Ascobolus immersus RN42]